MTASSAPRTIKARLERLEEAQSDGTSRFIVMKAYRNMEDGECNAFLAGQGIIVTKADQVVCLTTIYEDRDGSDALDAAPPSLIAVHPQKRTRP